MSGASTVSIDQPAIAAPAHLAGVPATLVQTREALHRLAEQVISPARRQVTGKIGLRATPDGFGTPVFGDGRRVAVQGMELLVVEAESERRAPITTLRAAAEHVGPGALPDDVELDDHALPLDAAATSLLAGFFALGASTLLTLREQAGSAAEPSLIQLWPEHFDIAVELGDHSAGARANYGFSPGDADHPEPYAYVGPWEPVERGSVWNAVGFPGAQLAYAELRAAEDPRALALSFMTTRWEVLRG